MDAWIVTPISKRARVTRAGLSLLVGFGLALWLWSVQYANHVLLQNWYVPALLPVIGAWLAWRFYRKRERRELSFAWQPIPAATRIKRGAVGLLGMFLVGVLVWLGQYAEDSLHDNWWYVWPIAVPGAIWVLAQLLKSKRKVLLPAAEVERERVAVENQLKQQESARQSDELISRWYLRYPIAAVMLLAAYWAAVKAVHLWWLALLLVVVAALEAWELSLLALAGLVAYWLFKGVAALPVSVAVVVGALIIATALRKGRNG